MRGELRQKISDFIPKQVVDISESGVWSEKFRTSDEVKVAKEWLTKQGLLK